MMQQCNLNWLPPGLQLLSGLQLALLPTHFQKLWMLHLANASPFAWLIVKVLHVPSSL